jgi:uncharacterized protein YbjT (DUF2867 family)
MELAPFESPERHKLDLQKGAGFLPGPSSRQENGETAMILLTGVTGMAGSHIANEFAKRREPVRVLVREHAKAALLNSVPTVQVIQGDMAKPDTLGAALEGVERVLMISSSTPDMLETQCTFIDACKAAGVRHMIKFSGLAAHPDALFLFGRLHLEAEKYLERSGLKWTHLRPTGFMQEYLREAPSIVHEGALYLPLGDTKLNPVDLADVGKIGYHLLRAGGHEGAHLPVTGPEALNMSEIAAAISQASGRTVRYVPVSRLQRREALIAHGIPEMFADLLDKQVEERLQGGLESRVDVSTHELFEIQPTTFLNFASKNAEAFGGAPRLVAMQRLAS